MNRRDADSAEKGTDRIWADERQHSRELLSQLRGDGSDLDA